MGETVTSSTGLPARLNRPLDFLVVSDHAENLGLAPAIAESNPDLLKNAWGKEQHDLVKSGTEGAIQAYEHWMAKNATQDNPLADIPQLAETYWAKIIEAAEKYRITSYNVCYTKLLRHDPPAAPHDNGYASPHRRTDRWRTPQPVAASVAPPIPFGAHSYCL